MAGSIKGITIEFNGDVTKLQKALGTIKNETKGVDKELRQINTALKFNPGNTELVAQKMTVLKDRIEATKKQLKELKDAQKQLDAQGIDKNSQEYRSLQREIIQTESKLKSFQAELRKTSTIKLRELADQFDKIGDKMQNIGKGMMTKVTTPIVGAFAAMTKAASDYEENQNKVNEVFGKSSDAVTKFASTATDKFGISKSAALDMSAGFGDMATSMGLSEAEAAKMSTSLVGLTGDVASFKNIGLDEASTALTGIFTGETESLKRLGVVMTEANLQQYALAQGYEKSYKEMTQGEKVMLRYQYVMDSLKNSQGDYARTSDGFANSFRTLQQHIINVATDMGELLLPYVTKAINKINDLVSKFEKLDDHTKKVILAIAGIAAAIGPVLLVGGTLSKGVGKILAGIAGIIEKGGLLGSLLGALTSPIGLVVLAIAGLTAGFLAAAKAPDTLGKALLEFIKKAGEKFVKFIEELPEKLKSLAANLGKAMSDGFAGMGKNMKTAEFIKQFITVVSQTYSAIKQAIIENAPEIIAALAQIVSLIIQNLKTKIPQILEAAKAVFGALVTAVTAILPELVSALAAMVEVIVPAIVELAPQILQAGLDIFLSLVQAVVQIIPQIVQAISNMIPVIVGALVQAAPTLLQGAITMFMALLNALIQVLPQLIEALISMIPKLVDTLIAAIPVLLQGAVQLFMALVEALPVIIPKLLEALGALVIAIGQALINHGPEILASALSAFGAILEAFLSIHLKVLEAIGAFLADLGVNLIDKIHEKLEALKAWIHEKWENLKTDASEAWAKIKEFIMTPIDEAKKYVEEKLEALKNWIHDKWENLKTTTSTAWNKIKEFITTPIANAKQNVEEKINSLKTWIQNRWDNIKTATSSAWNRVKEAISTAVSNAKSAVQDRISSLKDWILGKWDDIKKRTGEKWEDIKEKILSPIRGLKEKIADIIDDIKDLFDIDIPTPHIPEPDFDISPSWWTFEDLLDGVVPSIDISWHKEGGIFRRPTLLGGGNGVGEAGPEAVLPLDQLWAQLNQMANSIVNGILLGMQQTQAAQNNGEIHLDVYLYPSGPKMGEQVVNAYDRYKPVYG